jgi:hypothetical protein
MMRMVSVETASLSDKSPEQPYCQIKSRSASLSDKRASLSDKSPNQRHGQIKVQNSLIVR